MFSELIEPTLECGARCHCDLWGLLEICFPHCLCGPLETATPRALPSEVSGEKQAQNQIANVQNNSLPLQEWTQSMNIDMWDIVGLFCPASNDHGLCPMTTRGPLMSSWFGLNSVMLLGRALGLMNSSASWRPWMEGQGPLWGGWGARGKGRREANQRILLQSMRKRQAKC